MAEAVDAPFDRPDVGFNALEGWSWIGCYGGYYLQCDLLGGFEHGFFTRQWQGRGPEVLAGVISAGVSVHRPSQIHGAVVLPASGATAAPWPEADGLVSDQGAQSLWVCGADCPPVLIADRSSGRVAACHAGWRGVAGRILPEAIRQLEAAGSLRGDLLVALGPAISGPNYQVERSVSEQVALALGGDALDLKLAALEAVSAISPDGEPGRDRLDLRRAIRLQLEQEGIAPGQISSCPLCTLAEPLLFHSWRRDQVKAVQWSGIVAQA
ncbi:peptidoglycan editing factor PgeF [Cyanobium sp. ATX 6F1]|uniref:peptidoglycan editing factor PgeF n=1 Tax=Cyanobium sp. ATX 6F1 TaxID=2823702 RepID=UPI0020CC335F|nr:peptidoglycan editing factor PgeF [Cyanobium sp. ATX 6F1]MCP9915479.1 peptidoglycan editing factor PgeF [Cyanobium sp. ATX 6F1]